MILSKVTKTKWNSKTKKYYEDKGYVYTAMGEYFYVKVSDLPLTSRSTIIVVCDYCNDTYETTFQNRNKSFNKNTITSKDVCCKKSCISEKIKESNLKKYGTEHHITSKKVQEKVKKTLKDTYGVENPFQIEEAKIKIKKTIMDKYGVHSYVLTDKYKIDSKKTNLERYGFEIPMHNKDIKQKVIDKISGENSYMWKGGIAPINDKIRNSSEYKNWRKEVYHRDNYTCQCCNIRGSKLNAHHINNFSTDVHNRFNVDNGITFCEECHIEFHKVFGKKDNNYSQVLKFISTMTKTYAEL